MRHVVTMMFVCAAAAATARAQDPVAVAGPQPERQMLEMKLQAERAAVQSRITRGAPYSAEAVTESVQVLSDGNRIVTKSTSRIYRDSEGRTRRERLDAASLEPNVIDISDPVAEATYVLDPASRTAFHNGIIIATPTGAVAASVTPGSEGTITVARTPQGGYSVSATETGSRQGTEMRARGGGVAAGAGGGGVFIGARGAGGALSSKIAAEGGAAGQTTREDLGQQMVEGVTAAGTRTTTEIPAGAIGNEQPIRIVSEQWFSPELQVLVLTRHTDPRMGETTYRLTNIVRTEPPRSLFELPPDYTVKESMIRRQER